MSVQKLKVEMDVPKEGKEIVDALEAIVKHFKEKKSLSEAAALLPPIMAAVDGIDGLGEELKSDGKDELAAYLLHKVMGALV